MRTVLPLISLSVRRAAAASFALGLLLAACGAEQRACRVGADCASSVCLSNGSCAPVAAPTDAGEDGGEPDGGFQADAGDAAADGGFDGGTSVTCAPNHDGTITSAELPLRAGLRATYRAAEDVTVSTAGTTGADGGRVWSFDGALSGDASSLWETESPAGAWWAADFPTATYSARLSVSSELRGVFEVKSDGLYLLGVVSKTSTYPSTKVSYSPAVKVFALPLSSGASWQTNSTVSGTYVGTAVYYTEAYSSSVDATGEARTPFATFPVLRVRTVLTKNVGGFITVTRTFAFASECFGPVAQVVSQSNESSVEFTDAAEVRRLAP